MTYESRHDVVFEELFENNPEGHALYKPFASSELSPGVCGYFDHDGDWQTIGNLRDPAALEADGWTEATGIEMKPDLVDEYWGAMVSNSVEKFYPSVDVNVTCVNLRSDLYTANAFHTTLKTDHELYAGCREPQLGEGLRSDIRFTTKLEVLWSQIARSLITSSRPQLAQTPRAGSSKTRSLSCIDLALTRG